MFGVFFAYLFVASALACEHQDQYKKIGCFDSSHLETTLVFNNNDDAFNLENYKDKLPELVCNCFNKTRDHYKYFSVGKNGDCFGGKFEDEPVENAASSGHCVTANDNHHGGGQEESEYLYKIEAAAQRPQNGGETEWGEWSECDVSCGGGQQSRERTCTNPIPNDSGSPCGDLTQVQDCNTHHCPIDGKWSAYRSFGECSKVCGGGIKQKHRECNNPAPQHGGKDCEGPSTESASCNTGACCEDKQTSMNDDGDGKMWYLDRHALSCGSGKAINQFKLNRNGAHTKYQYKYKCCYVQSKSTCTKRYKENGFTEDGEGGWLGDKQTAEYLDRQNVQCNADEFISSFKLKRNSGHDKVRYEYHCCKLASTDSQTCVDKKTAEKDDGDGDTVYLDRHNVDCGGDEYTLRQFQLRRNSGHTKFYYEYKCCKAN